MAKLTRKKALDMSIDLWKWLSENPRKWKYDYPKYKMIEKLNCDCPLCELYFPLMSQYSHDKCPLYTEENITCCSEYDLWWQKINKKKNATAIYKKLLKAREEL